MSTSPPASADAGGSTGSGSSSPAPPGGTDLESSTTLTANSTLRGGSRKPLAHSLLDLPGRLLGDVPNAVDTAVEPPGPGDPAADGRPGFLTELRTASMPVVPSALISALLAVGIASAFAKLDLPTLLLLAGVVVVSQCVIAVLLVSRRRREELEQRSRQLAGFQMALLSALLRTLDMRDRMTARHSAAVARYARELAASAGLSAEEQELAHSAGLLHDIGKFVLPDEVLKTRGVLTDEDWEQIKRHPYEGARIVSQIDGYTPVGDIILAHHERLDGTGYPRGLKGDEIPVVARIIAVCDTYDAMTARDSYREPRSSFEAIAEMRRVAGTQLDPDLVEHFVQLLANKTLAYRHGEDADFEAELALDKRIHDYVSQTSTAAGPAKSTPSRTTAA
jgi:putative nucleotidyltransferase with HDIG domain